MPEDSIRETLDDARAADGCPVCGGDLVDVQGILDCADCGRFLV